ncbi:MULTISPECIES: translation elongation factor 4 [unclassified Faecalibacterium]|uniref:translation elongation factor 4 n=1 Tax=unclassified Faecalibacterium TaxID=2646395 RepID=UPI000B395588|nr:MULTISPECIES: translation elongation factor 4 [unclassified Faecalibacterium]OUN67882.1 elongation factor 4 [Faecalibacterium sp. An58]OUQ37405.1 elongation factor 4 [Faecalibacterium sp. An121]
MANKNIRNFCIIAHIDHGKSTLSDRILELTESVDERTMEDQILDNMDIERERGITIKARAVTMHYTAKDGQVYELNLIDTPGHVDFAYEVSRSLAACEGAILVVDATQGVEAQTLANTYMALEHDLEIVPVLNKIDLPSAHPDEVAQEVEDVIGLPCLDAPRISAKTGLNVGDVLERVVADIPAPTGDPDAPLKALIFDSVYDSYKGVIVYIRVFEGTVKPGDTILMMATGAKFTLVEVGHMGATSLSPCQQLSAGEVGYLTASIKTVQDTRVGDTVTLADRPTPEALPGYRQVKPMVFCGIYPADGKRYPDLKDALEKLQLNDASLTYEPENSAALGFGFRCGFLGLLHMEIITERLEREFDLDLVTTTPGVQYRITMTDGEVRTISNPSEYPDPSQIASQEEPFVDVHLYTPNDYVGGLMDLCQQKRGELIDMKYLDDVRVDLHYAMPLGEIVYDFFDAIKSRSRGYASYDYEFKEYRESDLVRLDFLLAGDPVDALSMIVFRDNAYAKGRRICEKLRDNIPRTLFEIPVQAAVGGKIIARETVKALRKDVLAKCYGGDITRKKKLLEKQKEGKKKMRQLGSVSLPSEAFTAVLKLDNDDD